MGGGEESGGWEEGRRSEGWEEGRRRSLEEVDKASNFFMSLSSFHSPLPTFLYSHSHPLTFLACSNFSVPLYIFPFLSSCLLLPFMLMPPPPPSLPLPPPSPPRHPPPPPLPHPPLPSNFLFLLQMFEAREQRGDLIRELRSTHALQSPEQKEKKREKMDVLSKQTRRSEDGEEWECSNVHIPVYQYSVQRRVVERERGHIYTSIPVQCVEKSGRERERAHIHQYTSTVCREEW